MVNTVPTPNTILLQSCKILDSAETFHSQKVKEALYIKEFKPVLNRDGGLELPHIYRELLSCGNCGSG